jgi:hypothetical protein
MWQAEEPTATTQETRSISGLPVDPRILFACPEGDDAQGVEVRKTGLLAKMSFLRKFLQENERVVFVTTAYAPSTVGEFLTLGAGLREAVKRVVFVFTDRRLFCIPATWRHGYRGMVTQAWYADCKSVRVEGSALVLEYVSGKQEKFPTIPRADRPLLMQIPTNADHGAPAGDEDGHTAPRERHHLCPSCTGVLTPRVWTCPHCGLEFKTEREAHIQALAIPGGGYFYANHLIVGTIYSAVESYLMILMFIGGLRWVRGLTDAQLLGLATVLLLAEKLMARYHARREMAQFIPSDLKPLLAEAKAPPAAAAAAQTAPQESPEEVAAAR